MLRFVILLLLVLGCVGRTRGQGPEVRRLAIQSEITDVQPMTGIVLWHDNAKLNSYSNSIALEYRYWGYNEIVDAEGRYDFANFEDWLDDVASRNHQAVVRFYFCYVGQPTTVPKFLIDNPEYQETIGVSEEQETHFCDWRYPGLQQFTLDFYTRFAKRYDDDPRIAFLQTGFGLWAEYHIYSGPKVMGRTFPGKPFQRKFLNHLDQQFERLPWSISIDAADSDYTPIVDDPSLLALDFGVFDDSFLCKPHPKENAVNWRELGKDRWQRQPGGGEFSYYTRRDQREALSREGPHGIPFEAAAKQFHLSYIIGNDQTQFQTAARIRNASMATGYRFRLLSAVVEGGSLRLQVTNEGVAPIYRDAFFAAGRQRTKGSLRGLLPGQRREYVIDNVSEEDLQSLTIQSDEILPGQSIQFSADLN